ncbi:hypothetical protein [Spiroplasma endosymbiont of Amphibalanus improvisus]|uniref:hypothetical protein n=1 Tax=Spiroplasma endosymbiont of Amphibalanus improvisus TaxID=3066327 RepID=UPI00313B3B5A
MPIFLIILIANISIVIFIIFILGIFQQFVIKKYNTKEQELTAKIKEINNSYKELISIKTEWNLKPQEILYYQSKSCSIYKANEKENKKNQINKSQNKIVNFSIYNLNGYLNLKSHNFSKNDVYEGIIYITNKRIIISGAKFNTSIQIDSINMINPSIFHINGEYHIGFVIFTENNIYKGISQDLKISKIIHLLLKVKG